MWLTPPISIWATRSVVMTLQSVLNQNLASRDLVDRWIGWEKTQQTVDGVLRADRLFHILGIVMWLIILFGFGTTLSSLGIVVWSFEPDFQLVYHTIAMAISFILLEIVIKFRRHFDRLRSAGVEIVRNIHSLRDELGLGSEYLGESLGREMVERHLVDLAFMVLKAELSLGDKKLSMDEQCRAAFHRYYRKREFSSLYAAALKFGLVSEAGRYWSVARAKFSPIDQELLGERG